MPQESHTASVQKLQAPPPTASQLTPSVSAPPELAAWGPPRFVALPPPPTEASPTSAGDRITFLVSKSASVSKSPPPVRPHSLQNTMPVATLRSQHQVPADAACSPMCQETPTSSAMAPRLRAQVLSGNLTPSSFDETTDSTISIAHGQPSLVGALRASIEDGCPGQKRERSPGHVHVDEHAAKPHKLQRRNEIHTRTDMESAKEHGCFASTLSEAVKKARDQRGFLEEEAATTEVEANAASDPLQDEDAKKESAQEADGQESEAEKAARKEEAEFAANIAAAEKAEERVVGAEQQHRDNADHQIKATVPWITPKPAAGNDDDAERLVRMTLSYADRLLKAAAKDLEDERREKVEAEARKSQEAKLERQKQMSAEKQSIPGEKTDEEPLAKVESSKTAEEERLADEATKAAELAREAKAKKLAADEEIRRCHLQKHRELMAERKLKKVTKGKRGKEPSEETPAEASSSSSSAVKAPTRPASAAASEAAAGEQRTKRAADAHRKTELDRLAALWKVRQQQIVDSRR